MTLTSKQTSFLRGLAHNIKPVVNIGINGASPEVLKEIERGLTNHELIKIKVACENQAELKEILEAIIEGVKANLVQVIGHMVVLYRESLKKEEKDRIRLPN